MKIPGLSDSLASRAAGLPECPSCGADARISGGACVSCLLRTALAESNDAEREDFDALLSEVDVRDTDWRLGNYQILEEIGRGGMGVIYRARQRHSKRIVALKRVLSYHSDSRETLERFRREAEAAASLDHPNILPIHEVSESEGLPFFTMKYATGGSLQQAAPALSAEPRECVRLLAKITRAVAYAHREGILHRDLKPGNILLDGRGEPLVSDFGLAKWIDANSDLTRSLTVFGTPGYIAPEQAQGPAAALTPAADIYSLGAILFDLLTGRPPFLGEHALAVIREAAEKPAPKLRTLLRAADRDLETICAKCLEREPRTRYRSASDLADDLERWLEGRTIVARPVSPPAQLWRWARRNPTLAGALAVCAIIGATALLRETRRLHLLGEVYEAQAQARSIAILPFLNLDNAEADFASAESVAVALRPALAGMGPSRIVLVPHAPAHWTGTGNVDEVRSTGRQTDSRAILSGTVRRAQDGLRVSLHLTSANGADALGHWIVKGRDMDREFAATIVRQAATDIYHATDAPTGPDAVPRLPAQDPGWKTEASRASLNAGRLLLDRRTIVDTDRAIASFEAAIRVEPRSIEARSYLAMACIGRNFLRADPVLADRATEVAREALTLAPDNPTAHRGLCAIYTFMGRNRDALEHGLRALEAGDTSERAFGQIAYAWKQLGRPDKAIRWLMAAKVSPTQPADYEALIGDCWAALGDDEKAADSYEAAARFRPDLPEGWLGLCHLKLLRGEFEAARAIFRERSAEFTAFPVARQMQAHIEFFSRNDAEAVRAYRELHRDDPLGTGRQQYGAISYRAALARLLTHSGQSTDALQFLEECRAQDSAELAQAPENPETLYRLAATEALRADHESALNYLAASIANGWIDYRSPRLDPRFDAISNDPRFTRILHDLAAHVADLRQQQPAGQVALTKEKDLQ